VGNRKTDIKWMKVIRAEAPSFGVKGLPEEAWGFWS
jgi:hypothetical protein